MGDDRSTNAIPTGVWVRRELVDALREALPDSYRPGMYVALHDAARSVVDAVETEGEPKVPMTDLPDAETAWREWFPVDEKSPRPGEREAFLAGLDAANAEREALKQEVADRVGDLVTLQRHLDAALARNAESYEDGYNQGHADAHADGAAPDRLCALRAELDNLRGKLTALADETPWKTTDHLGNVTGYLINADELRAIVRGSDDE